MNREQRRGQVKGLPQTALLKAGDSVRIARLFADALAHHQAGHLAEAESLYQGILARDVRHADSLHLLGLVTHQKGRNELAVELIGRALAIDAGNVLFRGNLGIVLKHLGRHGEAVAAYRAALSLDPANAQALSNLAVVLVEMDRAEEAYAAAEAAIRLKPDFPEAHNNLGNALRMLGRWPESLEACKAAIRLNGSLTGAYDTLGAVLFDLGRVKEALAAYQAALCIDPAQPDGYAKRGAVLLGLDMVLLAFASACQSLRLADTLKAGMVFSECMKRLSFSECPDEVRGWMVRAIGEPWGRPKELARPAMRQIRTSPACVRLLEAASSEWSRPQLDQALTTLETDPLLLRLLQVSVIPDIGFERLLTACRSALLKHVQQEGASGALPARTLIFVCALAQQCFINDYVYFAADEEMKLAESLRQSLDGLLRQGAPVPAERLVLLACYFPLHHLEAAGRLLDMKWERPVEEVLTRQVREPLAERQLATRIVRLNEVEDGTSVVVRRQYEENPYPRWVRIAPVEAAPSLDHYMQSNFRSPAYQPQGKARPDILIAGCGTGQHPIETARQFPYANLLAVDLSLASLAYAQRMAIAGGVANIEFAQADLLRLGGLGRQFDVIESVGVLHHLREPLAGMRVLASLLQPNGVFRLGLYSELARKSVVAVRDYIAQQGMSSSAADIRRCRQELLKLADGDIRKRIVTSSDFFSTSDCRDLLFHVQEHRVSIPEIVGWLGELGLTFIAFVVKPDVEQNFRQRFPHQGAAGDLGLWHSFEQDNPDTFAGMYQFWVQKAPA